MQVKNGDEWDTLEDQAAVEPAIMNNNSARFSLTEKTPLISQHMSSKLGYLADTKYAADILDGKFIPDSDMDEYTNNFLTFIGKRRQLTNFSADILRDDFIQFWKGARAKNQHHSLVVILDITKLHHVVRILVKFMLHFNIWLLNQEYG